MSTNDPHTLKSFEDALSDLRKDLLMMFSLTRQNLARALKGLFERDIELCKVTIADDEEIDQLEKEIDARGMRFSCDSSRSPSICAGSWRRSR